MDGLDEIQSPKPRPKKAAVPKYKPKLVRRKPEPPPEPQGPVRMVLGVRHFINGQVYGPGVTDVPDHLVSALRETEQRNAAEEQGLRENKAAIIGRGNRKIPVDPSYFDNPDALQNLPGV